VIRWTLGSERLEDEALNWTQSDWHDTKDISFFVEELSPDRDQLVSFHFVHSDPFHSLRQPAKLKAKETTKATS
jgi:hypothetical protein